MTTDYTDYWAKLTVSHASHPANRFRYGIIAQELVALNLRPDRVLDCGCGDGSLLNIVTSAIPCKEVCGMDIAENVPVNRPGSGVRFYQQNLSAAVPQAMWGQFDLVLCSEVVEHVPDDSMAIENLSKLLRRGGWLVLTTQSGNIYKTEQFLGHLRHYKLRDLRARVEAAGLQVHRAYVCGWPFLNMQKVLAHIFQGTVQKEIVQAKRLGWHVRGLFWLFRRLYGVASRRRGPQIVILASKAEATGH